ncbi:hypothetical protein ACWGTI_11890 [Mesorhizobium sp. ArgA1]
MDVATGLISLTLTPSIATGSMGIQSGVTTWPSAVPVAIQPVGFVRSLSCTGAPNSA